MMCEVPWHVTVHEPLNIPSDRYSSCPVIGFGKTIDVSKLIRWLLLIRLPWAELTP